MIGISVYIDQVFEEAYEDETYVDWVQRAADAGADAFELWPWDHDDLDDIAAKGRECGLDFNYMTGPTEWMTTPGNHEAAVEAVENAIDTAARLDCNRIHPAVGGDIDGCSRDEQVARIVDVFEEVVPTAEERGVTMVLEPRNAIDHPQYFLRSTREIYPIVEAVDSPNLKVLLDVYHEQMMAGNIINNIHENGEHIDHVHFSDVPTRAEPGTGELNYTNIFAALDEVGYDGYVACEFTPTYEPERAVRDVRELLP